MAAPLLVAMTSKTCQEGAHVGCPARLKVTHGARTELVVCPCDCHLAAGEVVAGEHTVRVGPSADPEVTASAIRAWAAKLGRRGGRKGGPARAAALTPERRSEIARAGAQARWGRRP